MGLGSGIAQSPGDLRSAGKYIFIGQGLRPRCNQLSSFFFWRLIFSTLINTPSGKNRFYRAAREKNGFLTVFTPNSALFCLNCRSRFFTVFYWFQFKAINSYDPGFFFGGFAIPAGFFSTGVPPFPAWAYHGLWRAGHKPSLVHGAHFRRWLYLFFKPDRFHRFGENAWLFPLVFSISGNVALADFPGKTYTLETETIKKTKILIAPWWGGKNGDEACNKPVNFWPLISSW